ncbi:MAG TPA: L,D-transpeptidase family protein [Pyrinomonadaceae bacterium]|nr:L,D-transpeptidase family protein [Pyrinomonadaceae bacterium]
MKTLFTILLVAFLPLFGNAQRHAAGNKQRAALNRAQIREAERQLADLGYWTGPVDGVFDSATRSALIAFQKWERRPANGRLTSDELEAIHDSKTPEARETGYGHVEVDLDRQVLLLIDDAGGVRVLPVSSGSGKPFRNQGKMGIAYTPRGRFLVYQKGAGWQKGPLGSMYYPSYISGGIAIHGSGSVPNQPASHGCVRIPVFAAQEVSKQLTIGTIVLLYDERSFVSAKEWALNPKLKQAVLQRSSSPDLQ